jgi:hypothetical protein
MVQQFQIQDFDSRSSVVAQLRPLIKLSTINKDNATTQQNQPLRGRFGGRRNALQSGSGGRPPQNTVRQAQSTPNLEWISLQGQFSAGKSLMI